MDESTILVRADELPVKNGAVNGSPQSFEKYVHEQMHSEDGRGLDLTQYADGSIVELAPASRVGVDMYAMFYEVEQEGKQEAIVINSQKIVAFGKRVCRTAEGKVFTEWAPMIQDADSGVATVDEVQTFLGIETSPEPSRETKEKAFDLAMEHGAVELDFSLYDQPLMS